ncbi:universal stress protein [Athalassotoga sp.]|uniref:universal stress protein n=2 Tax=Athalassotoga sp. TaxID=2022597 RepID=UPI003D01CAA1
MGKVGDKMYKKILIAVDGSEISKVVFERGIEISKREGSQAAVIAVVDTTTMYNFAAASEMNPSFLNVQAQVLRDQEMAMRKFISSLKEYCDYGFEEEVRTGIPNKEIIAYAEKWKADLLVVGSYGKGGWVSEFLFGTTAEKLIRTAKTDVLVVKCKGEKE